MSLDVELRLLAACLFMHPSASLYRGSPRRLASDPFNRCPDICRSIGIGRGILFLRSTRVTSAHVDERDSIFAMFARPRRWSLAEQRARRARSPLQSQIRFHAHAQVRHRTQITTVADLQIQTAQIGAPARRAGFRDLFHLLPVVRNCSRAVHLNTVPAHVPEWFPLCLSIFAGHSLAKDQFWQLTGGHRNSRVTKSKLSSKKVRMRRSLVLILSLISVAPGLFATQVVDPSTRLVISVSDQKLMLLQNGGKIATYPISTSMFGLGDYWGRMTTPLGYLAVAQKIGDHAPIGAVFHNRRFTGEILAPDAPGRDPVITRIIWLRGLEAQNAHAFSRCIYIHGTPQEKNIGRPASYGCIRMKSSDIAALYNQLTLGSIVQIVPDHLPKVPKATPLPSNNTLVAAVEKTNSQNQLGSSSTSTSLTIEQMRMGGALAAERRKSQARGEQTNTTRESIAHPTDKAPPVLNKGAVTALSPRA